MREGKIVFAFLFRIALGEPPTSVYLASRRRFKKIGFGNALGGIFICLRERSLWKRTPRGLRVRRTLYFFFFHIEIDRGITERGQSRSI